MALDQRSLLSSRQERADALAARGAEGLTKLLPVFTATPVGPRRQRLVGKTACVSSTPAPEVNASAVHDLPPPAVSWDALSQLLVNVASSLIGTRSSSSLWTPYTQEDRVKLDFMQTQVAATYAQLSAALSVEERVEPAKHHRTAKKAKQVFQRQCRCGWLQDIVKELESCSDSANWGRFYYLLRRLGVVVKGTAAEGRADFSPEQLRQHALKIGEQLEANVDTDMLLEQIPQRPVHASLGLPPSDDEVRAALQSQGKCPGPDQVTILMIRSAGPRAKWQIRLLMHQLWTTPPEQWEACVKQVVGIPLFKGGDGCRRQNLDNYRYIMLIGVLSRAIGKIISTRLQNVAEQNDLYGDWQYGFRRGRSVIDVLLLVRTMTELASAVPQADAHRYEEQYKTLVLILFDIQKAYNKVQRGAAWTAFRRLGIPNSLLEVLPALRFSACLLVSGKVVVRRLLFTICGTV